MHFDWNVNVENILSLTMMLGSGWLVVTRHLKALSVLERLQKQTASALEVVSVSLASVSRQLYDHGERLAHIEGKLEIEFNRRHP